MNRTTSTSSRTTARLALVTAAVVSTMLIWLITELTGLDVAVIMSDSVQSISGVTVAVATAIAGLGAWAVKAATERLLRHHTSWWVTISLTVAVLSLLGPLTSAASTPAGGALAAMHLVAAAILIPGLARTGPRPMRGVTTHESIPFNDSDSTEAASMGSGYGGAP